VTRSGPARVANDPVAIVAVVAAAGPEPEVVIEATGWYWVVDLLQPTAPGCTWPTPRGSTGVGGG
jgi:hypothetical protein